MQRDSKRRAQPIAPVPQPRLQRRTETPDNTAQQAARANQQAARQANHANFIQRFATTPEAQLATDILSTQAPSSDHHSAARALPGAGRVRLQRLLQSPHVAGKLSLGREPLNPVQRLSNQTVEDLTGLPLQRAAAPTANLETRLQRHRDAKASLQATALEPTRSPDLEVQRTPLEGRSPGLNVQRADDGQNQLGHTSPNLSRNVQRSPDHSDAVSDHISTAQTARVQRQRAVNARAGELKAQMLSTQVQRLRAPDAPALEPSGKAYTLTGQADRINTELPVMRAKHNHDPAYLDGDTKPVTDFSRHVGLSLGRQYHVQRTKSGARPRDLSAVISRVHDTHDRANLLTSTLTTFNPNDREAASVQRLVAERETELEVQRSALESDLEPVTQRLAEREAQQPDNLAAMIARAGGGEELPEKVKRQLQPQFNFSLDIVRIHRDGYADKLAKTVNAVAFTTGASIFFRSGKFDPSSASGRGLLVHELTHVGQQLGGLVAKGIDENGTGGSNETAAATAGAIEESKGALPEPDARDAVESRRVGGGTRVRQVAGEISVLQRTPDKPRGKTKSKRTSNKKKSKRISSDSKITKEENDSKSFELNYTFNINPARIFIAKGSSKIRLYWLTSADIKGMQEVCKATYGWTFSVMEFPDAVDGIAKPYFYLEDVKRNKVFINNALSEKVSDKEETDSVNQKEAVDNEREKQEKNQGGTNLGERKVDFGIKSDQSAVVPQGTEASYRVHHPGNSAAFSTPTKKSEENFVYTWTRKLQKGRIYDRGDISGREALEHKSLGSYNPTFLWSLEYPGDHTLEVDVYCLKTRLHTLYSFEQKVVSKEDFASLALEKNKGNSTSNWTFESWDKSKESLSNEKQNAESLIKSSADNPAVVSKASGWVTSINYKMTQPLSDTISYKWYAVPLDTDKQLTSDFYEQTTTQFDVFQLAYALNTDGLNATFKALSGNFNIICEEISGDRKEPRRSEYRQSIVTDVQYEDVKSDREYLTKVKELTSRAIYGKVIRLNAVLIEKNSSAKFPLELLLMKCPFPDNYVILDTISRVEYKGATYADAIEDFRTGNKYASGKIHIDMPENTKGFEQSRISFETTGKSRAEELSETGSNLSTGLTILAIAAAFTGNIPLSVLLFQGSLVAGVASSVLSIKDKLRDPKVSKLKVGFEIATLLTTIAQFQGGKYVANLAGYTDNGKWLFKLAESGDKAQYLIGQTEQVVEIVNVLNNPKMSIEEKKNRVLNAIKGIIVARIADDTTDGVAGAVANVNPVKSNSIGKKKLNPTGKERPKIKPISEKRLKNPDFQNFSKAELYKMATNRSLLIGETPKQRDKRVLRARKLYSKLYGEDI